jgi:hypothetical protein
MIIIINSDHINKHYYLTFFTEYVIKRFKCHLCDSKTQTYFNLLTHMATLHFKANLKLQYGDREWECGLCKKVDWSFINPIVYTRGGQTFSVAGHFQ